MKITDGIKLWIGFCIVKMSLNSIVKASEKVKNYILENDFDDEDMKTIKEYLEKVCKPKKKVKKEDYTKIKIRGFRAD